MSNDPRQCGDGRDEVIPSFGGKDIRRYERRVDSTRGGFFSLCPRHEWLQREGLVNFGSGWKDVQSIHVREYRTWKHRMVSRICLIT